MDLKSTAELTNAGVTFERIVIPSGTHTVEDVERACHCAKSAIIKTLLFVGQRPVMVLMTGDRQVDLAKLRKVHGDTALRMANKAEVRDMTAYAVGAVSPFGLPANIELLADEAVQALPALIMGSGRADTLISMAQADFLKSFKGTFAALAL